MNDQEVIRAALNGQDEAQRRIAIEGIAWLATLLKKNSDYGSSAWNPPALHTSLSPGDAILVRMSDKVARIANLNRPGQAASIKESIEDTIRDLGGYCLLWLIRPKEPLT